MNKLYLSAAVVAASVAVPALPAMAQANEIVIGITVTTTGPAAALGIRDDVQGAQIVGTTRSDELIEGLRRRADSESAKPRPTARRATRAKK